MAYSNVAWAIFEAMKDDIQAEIFGCEVVSRDRFPLGDDEKTFMAHHSKGVIIRVANDSQSEYAAEQYREAMYTFEARCYVRDPNQDQKSLMDFVEHVKYAIVQNPHTITNTAYQMTVNIEYPEPDEESKIKTANLTIEVLRPNA